MRSRPRRAIPAARRGRNATRSKVMWHRWERHEDAAWWVCEAPPEPRGPSYGTDPTVCLGCGLRITDEEVHRSGIEVTGRLELDLVLALRAKK